MKIRKIQNQNCNKNNQYNNRKNISFGQKSFFKYKGDVFLDTPYSTGIGERKELIEKMHNCAQEITLNKKLYLHHLHDLIDETTDAEYSEIFDNVLSARPKNRRDIGILYAQLSRASLLGDGVKVNTNYGVVHNGSESLEERLKIISKEYSNNIFVLEKNNKERVRTKGHKIEFIGENGKSISFKFLPIIKRLIFTQSSDKFIDVFMFHTIEQMIKRHYHCDNFINHIIRLPKI